MTQNVVETVSFKLANSVTTTQFLNIARSSETFVRAQPGFLSRHLCCGSDGRWTDTVIWSDMATAQAAAAAFPQQEFAALMMSAIAPETVAMRHDELHWSMAAA